MAGDAEKNQHPLLYDTVEVIAMDEEQKALLMDLPTSVRGFCYHDADGEEYVVLNSRLTHEQNRKTYRHEQEHIRRGDLDNPDYIEY